MREREGVGGGEQILEKEKKIAYSPLRR